MEHTQEKAKAVVKEMQALVEHDLTKETYARLLDLFIKFIEVTDELGDRVSDRDSTTASFR